MAKKTTSNVDDAFDLDMDLDDLDFDFKDPFVKDDRKPSIKFTEGIKTGVKTTLRDSRFIKDTLKEIFPASLGTAIDLYDDVNQTIKSLYDESVKDIKPTLKMARQTAAKLIPNDSKYLPKYAQDTLKRWKNEKNEEEAYTSEGPSQSQLRESLVAGTLQDIFKSQLRYNLETKAQDEGKEKLKDGISMIRHRDTLDALNRSAVALTRIDGYNTKINIGFQKKSLELGYRQLFALQDILDFQRTDAQRRDGILLAISKNTSLPEFVKIQDKEMRSQIAKNKRFEAFHSSMFGGRDRMLADTLAKAKDQILKTVQQHAMGAREGMMAASMAGDSNLGVDSSTMAGMMTGGIASEFGGKLLGYKLGEKLRGSKIDKKFGITKNFMRLDNFLEKIPGKINDFKKDKTVAWEDGILGAGKRLLQDLIPGVGVDSKLVSLKSADMDGPYHFTRRTDRSINTIIPGYLARIFRELQVTRTGNTKIGLTEFSHDDNRFMGADKLDAKIFKSIVPKEAVTEAQRRLDMILNLVDPDKTLNEKQRTEMKRKFLTLSAGKGNATEKNIASHMAYKGLNDEDRTGVVNHMRNFMRNADESKQLEFTRRFNKLATAIPDTRQAIQDHLDMGRKSSLRKYNLIDHKGEKIQLDSLISHYLNPENGEGVKKIKKVDPEMAGGFAFAKMAKHLNPGKSTYEHIKDKAEELKSKAEGAAQEGIDKVAEAAQSVSGKNMLAVLGKTAENTQQSLAAAKNAISSRISANEVRDVYVRGEVIPRLNAGAMAAGAYIDKNTGNIIKKIGDITGPVMDVANNTILAGEDLKKTLVVAAGGVGAKDLNTIIGEVKDVTAKFNTSHLGDLAKDFLKNTATEFNQQMADNDDSDLRVEGEPEPRMTQAGIHEGRYVNIDDEKVIKKHGDITGPVLDKKTQQVIVSREDVPLLKRFNFRLRKWSPLWIGSKIIKGLWHYQTKIAPKWAAFNLRMLYKGTVGLGKMVGSALGFAGRGMGITKQQPKDVYVKGEKTPRLYGVDFIRGEYRDLETGEVLKDQDGISGPVIDSSGQVVLSENDLDRLYTLDSFWKSINPLRLVGWVARKAKQLVKGAFNFTFKTAPKMAWNNLKFLGRLAGGAVKGLATLAGLRLKPQDIYVNGKENPILTGIKMKAGYYRDKLTGKIISSPNDINGPVVDDENQVVLDESDIRDGLRTVNGQVVKVKPSLFSRGMNLLSSVGRGLSAVAGLQVKRKLSVNKKDRAPATEAEEAQVKSSTTLEKILETVKSMGGKNTRKGSYEDEMSKMAELRKKVSPGDKKEGADKKGPSKGFFAKAKDAVEEGSNLWSMVKGLAGIGGAGAAGAATAGGVAAGAEVAAGAAAAGAGGAGLLATVGGGLLAFISSPVVLGVAAAALVGYGGYKLYQHMQRGKLSKLGQLRLTQYGIMPDDEDTAKKAIDLESYLSDYLIVSKNGVDINYKKISAKDLMGTFGIDPAKKDQVKVFEQWLQNRFKPVYLTHLTAIKAITGKTDLDSIDSLKKEQKLKYIEATKFPEGPYDFNMLPVFDKKVKVAGSKEVQQAIQDAMDELEGKDKKDDKEKSAWDKALPVLGVGAAAAGTLDENGKPTDLKSKLQSKDDTTIAKMAAGATSTAIQFGDDSGLTAFDAVRIKTYGLEKLDPTKVAALRSLEKELIGGVSYTSGGVASWNGDALALFNKVKGYFGIADLYSPEGVNWMNWFNKRFLPVYVGYLSAVRIKLGKPVSDTFQAANLLKPEDQLAVANILIGLPNVWDVKTSAWPNTKIANDPTITTGNIDFLKQKIKEKQVAEQKASPIAKPAPSETPKPINADKASDNSIKSASAANAASATGSNPDAEAKTEAGSAVGAGPAGAPSVGGLKLASGPLYDGRNAMTYLKLNKDVDIDSINPELRKNFLGMVEEYGTLAGKGTIVTAGARTREEQAALRNKLGARAAAPGSSLHEFGLALDVDPKALDEMEKMGLMRKYGFTRPVGAEPWHMEPIGIQANLDKYKQDTTLASQAVVAGLYKGGAGIGSKRSGRPYSRDPGDSAAILAASVSPSDPMAVGGGGATAVASNDPNANTTPRSKPTPLSKMPNMGANDTTIASASTANQSTGAAGVASAVEAQNDGEIKPSGPVGVHVSYSPAHGIPAASSTSPADPMIKVPDPKGPGIEGLRDTITSAAKMVGIDPNQLLASAAIESDFKPNARAGTSSGAGLYMNLNDNWSDLLKNYGGKYGYNAQNASPTDPKIASILNAHAIKANSDTLARSLGRQPGITENYVAHFLGINGARKFFSLLSTQPDTIAAQAMPAAAKANVSIFYDGQRPRTVAEVFGEIDRRVREKAKRYGIAVGESVVGMAGGNRPRIPGAGGYAEGAQAASDAAMSGPSAAPTAVSPANRPNVPAPTAGPTAVATPGASPEYPSSPTAVATPGASPEYPSSPTVPTVRRTRNVPGPYDITPSIPTPQPMTPTTVGGVNPNVFANAESILASQLDVQKNILTLLQKFVDQYQSKTEMQGPPASAQNTAQAPASEAPVVTAPPSNQQKPYEYALPKVSISMRRVSRVH